MYNPLMKEKIVSVSTLQKNPTKALNAPIVRIVKSGKELGIFMSREEFDDFIEDFLPLKASFQKKLKKSIAASKKKKKLVPLAALLK